MIGYIKTSREQEEGIWQTNIFGKSIGELVEDGIRSKITMMDDESQVKLQDTMQKIVNDSNGGCVLLYKKRVFVKQCAGIEKSEMQEERAGVSDF